jgi:hypothetical protein
MTLKKAVNLYSMIDLILNNALKLPLQGVGGLNG